MKCNVCGGKLERRVTSLPFKLNARSIVVVKELPVFECKNCIEFSIEDAVMAKVEELLKRVDEAAELEVVRYAA